jgi:hypothetical protein
VPGLYLRGKALAHAAVNIKRQSALVDDLCRMEQDAVAAVDEPAVILVAVFCPCGDVDSGRGFSAYYFILLGFSLKKCK